MFAAMGIVPILCIIFTIAFAKIDTNYSSVSDDNGVKISVTNNERHCPDNQTCIVKCCPLGESLGSHKLCQPTNLQFQVNFFGEGEGVWNYSHTEEVYHFIYGNPCQHGKYRLEPREDSNDEFHIMRNGSIRAPYLFPYPLMPDEYCLEVFWDPDLGEEDVLPLVCFEGPPPENERPIQYILYPIGLLISVPFLIATMLIYCLIPDLRDLNGKSLACHVICLAVAYIFLAAVQLVGDSMNQDTCTVFAFIIHFSFMACFFWLNVLCIDTWWNVRANTRFLWNPSPVEKNNYMGYTQLNGEVLMQKKTERKIFIFYSLYAWGCPVIFVMIPMIMDLMPTIPSSYLKPHFGENKCWFNSEEAELQYFYGPVGFLIFVNILLFILSSIYIFKYDWEHGETKRTPRQTFRMCFSLFGVMGINWMMEVASWAVGGPDYLWYVTDVINTLQGIIIFGIFVLEPRVRHLVRLQLWPKLLEILCKCHKNRVQIKVLYKSPQKAIEVVNGV